MFPTHAQDKKRVDFLDDQKAIDELFRLSLTESSVYPWLGDMCLNIGSRLSGSKQAEQAVEYSYELMTELGVNPQKQPVMVPHWVRGEKEIAFIKASDGTKLEVNVLALGGSIATPVDGMMAPIIEVETWEDLEELGEESIKGKIVFFNEEMNPENIYTFHSYGHCVQHRWAGAVQAAKYGAVGAIVRSLNLRIDEFPHTGSMTYEDALDTIPAAAISTRDAEIVSDLLAVGETVELIWKQSCQTFPDVQSYNVIGEIKGFKYPDEIILLGGHLDSWDLKLEKLVELHELQVLELLKKLWKNAPYELSFL